MTRHARRSAAGVRDRILDAAVALLSDEGVRGLTQTAVAARAGVRQSHLTYYFPHRDDLVDAVADRYVAGLAQGVRDAAAADEGDPAVLLTRLARSITEIGHMRMFVAMIVEADADPELRTRMISVTRRTETVVADALGGGPGARERARIVLAALWGLGLHHYLLRPSGRADPTAAYLSLLADV